MYRNQGQVDTKDGYHVLILARVPHPAAKSIAIPLDSRKFKPYTISLLINTAATTVIIARITKVPRPRARTRVALSTKVRIYLLTQSELRNA